MALPIKSKFNVQPLVETICDYYGLRDDSTDECVMRIVDDLQSGAFDDKLAQLLSANKKEGTNG